MEFAAQRVETLFQVRWFDGKIPRQPEKFEILPRHAENEVPQPQLFFAFGFSNTKPDCISDSL